jgi:hypothetical protein
LIFSCVYRCTYSVYFHIYSSEIQIRSSKTHFRLIFKQYLPFLIVVRIIKTHLVAQVVISTFPVKFYRKGTGLRFHITLLLLCEQPNPTLLRALNQISGYCF